MMTRSLTACLAMLFGSIFAQGTFAQNSVVRVEEDWQLHVTQPDVELDAPQVTTTMIPFGGHDDLLLQVDLNHATSPTFSKGGIQIRVCLQDDCLAQLRLLNNVRLNHDSETVKWTQVVQSAGNAFYFGIINGDSQTWGSFGGNSSFVYVNNVDAGGNLSLDNYLPQHSFENSSVTYANNRVGYLRLEKVRVYASNGLVTEWTINQDTL